MGPTAERAKGPHDGAIQSSRDAAFPLNWWRECEREQERARVRATERVKEREESKEQRERD